MAKLRISPVLVVALLVIIFFGVSLAFRISGPYNQIFVGDNIKYTQNDAYYYMRLVDNAANNFPHITQFDPYSIYPGGNNILNLSIFHWIIVFFAWIFGAGHPTQHLIDLIGAYLPAIMGALTVVPVFFIGKALFNKWAGVLAAGLVAILPGEFMSRSMLASSDNPVAEVFFTACALAFLIYAIKTASQNQLTFGHILKLDWKIILKPLILSLFAGIFLGFYLATWQGALLFVFIIMLYLVVQFIINHVKQKSNDYLCIVSGITFLFGLIILLINPFTTDITIAMVLAFLLPLVLWGISKALSIWGLNAFYFPLILIGFLYSPWKSKIKSGQQAKTYFYPLILIDLAVLAVVVVRFATPDIFSSLLAKFKFVFFPTGATAQTTIEMAPTLMPDYSTFTAYTAWANFTTSFFIWPWWLVIGGVVAAICGYFFWVRNKQQSPTPMFVVFLIVTFFLIGLTVQQFLISSVSSRYASDSVQFIPGLAFIALSILLYLFIRRDKTQSWYVATIWVLVILGAILLLMVLTTFIDIRYLALLPLIIIFYILFQQREGDEPVRLFIIWSLVILVILLIQRRFQYYFAVNAAVLSSYLCWEIIRLSGFERLTKKPEEAAKKALEFTPSAQKQNYYDLLGIDRNASYKEIKSAFRKNMSAYHPGPGNPPEVVEKIKELNRAYQILTNPTQRAAYEGTHHELSEKKKWQGHHTGGARGLYYVNVILSVVVVFLLVFCPTIARAQDQASQTPYAITNDWQKALLWMKDNTPDPMGDPNAYYQVYNAVPAGQSFIYPSSAYGVMAWWDYGYWITRIAHRIPNTNPSQNPAPIIKVANFFLSQDPAAAKDILKQLGSRYIISDYDVSTDKLAAIIDWAGLDSEKYVPTYYVAQGTQLFSTTLFSVDYYRTMIVRLYNFEGKAVTKTKATVIIYQIVQTSNGAQVKMITDSKDFDTYQEAQDYIATQDSTKLYDIVGTDPFTSPITLDALDDYSLIYTAATSDNDTQPVKILEYIGD
jgi:asparagine N-glycosylation enzyme membrane subunit Stt3